MRWDQYKTDFSRLIKIETIKYVSIKNLKELLPSLRKALLTGYNQPPEEINILIGRLEHSVCDT